MSGWYFKESLRYLWGMGMEIRMRMMNGAGRQDAIQSQSTRSTTRLLIMVTREFKRKESTYALLMSMPLAERLTPSSS